jgi:hypothetical protein
MPEEQHRWSFERARLEKPMPADRINGAPARNGFYAEIAWRMNLRNTVTRRMMINPFAHASEIS